MLAAFESKKGPITTRVRGGGDVIQKTTPMHPLKDLFIKYKVYELWLHVQLHFLCHLCKICLQSLKSAEHKFAAFRSF